MARKSYSAEFKTKLEKSRSQMLKTHQNLMQLTLERDFRPKIFNFFRESGVPVPKSGETDTQAVYSPAMQIAEYTTISALF